MTYNGLNVPPLIRVDRIISAFENCIDFDKVEQYTEIMRREMLNHQFPPIQGYPVILTEEDYLTTNFLNGEYVEEHNIGQIAWKVTDGHHRTIAAIEANVPHLEVELDYSCITNEEELKQFA